MSTVIVVAVPLVIAAWPTLTAAISAAVGTLGFAVTQKAAPQARQVRDAVNRAEIEVEDSEILEGTGATGEEMVVERDGIRAVFSRDARGSLKLCVEGRDLSKSELKQLGEDLIGRVTQQYVYHRLVSELKERDMNIVEEHMSEDQTIKIRVRHL
jgi:Protein of unknown function (DUF1257)